MKRRVKLFDNNNLNARYISIWEYLNLVNKYVEIERDKYDICAKKAAFSQHKITMDECDNILNNVVTVTDLLYDESKLYVKLKIKYIDVLK